MQSRFLLDVIIRQSAAIFQLLAGKDESLLIRRNPFLILDLSLHVIDRIRAFNFKRNSLPG
ncbi:hypothetical protein CY35_02G118400 [Sphagnum magellanicum]|nr:hypothetical protein CY35_02G118400 [Sphagnum magellanicum]